MGRSFLANLNKKIVVIEKRSSLPERGESTLTESEIIPRLDFLADHEPCKPRLGFPMFVVLMEEVHVLFGSGF